MPHLLVPAFAGILATIVYLAFTLLPRMLGIARVDTVRALGTFVTKNRETAFTPGLIITFALGILFAYVFYGVIAYIRGIPMNWLSGLFYGLVLGAVSMLYLVISVLEHHPDKSYQRRGPMTGLMHLIGMGLFGLVTGLLCGILAPMHLH